MAEYIEREAAMTVPVLPKEYRTYPTANLDDAYEAGWNDALENLRNIPAEDVLPVVWCSDCKYFQHYGRTSLFIDGKHVKAGWCTRRILCDEEYRMLPDGFCSCGVRIGGDDGKEGAQAQEGGSWALEASRAVRRRM